VRRRPRTFASIRLVCALSALLPISGCYFTRLAGRQLALLNEQRPLSEAVAREQNRQRRALLRMVPEIRAFARNVVQLPVGRSYAGYYATEARGILFVVVGSERLRLRPYTWWFPIVGTAAYKSFTHEPDARAEAVRLEQAGFDAWVGPVTAYSSLGFFRDPVTSVMMRGGVASFVEVLLHEMAHMRLYVSGHTDFNEQLATFVGQTAAEQYLRSRHRGIPAMAADLDRQKERRKHLDRALTAAWGQLESLYASAQPESAISRERVRVFAALQRELTRLYPERPASELVVNNARLLQYHRYLTGADRFAPLWARARGSWAGFWKLVEIEAQTL
jgi:predicted aminopeptidase